MTKIAKIKTLTNADEFVNILKDKNILIYEDIQGSKIFVNWTGSQFIIKNKTIKSEELNFVDLVIQKFYNQAFLYFHSLPDYITELMNTDWWFCFEYFPNDVKPANIEYRKLPKNNMILTCIVKGNNYVYDYDELYEYSKLFNVEPLPVVFKGKLSQKQLEVIELYLNTNEEDLKYIFDEDNFAYFFYKILNPKIESSFLMDTDEFNDNLEKIIIKIENNSKYSFEILNPLYKKMELNNNSEHVETYSLILLRFLEFCQLISIDKYKLGKISKDELYIEFICELFNEYMINNKRYLLQWDFTVPSFFKDDKFKINIDLVSNKETKEYIKSDDKIEYIFKSILGSFNKQKKKPIGVFNETTLELFNGFVDKLDTIIDKCLKINREKVLGKNDLHNFKDYFNLKYETDSTDAQYFPDMGDEFTEGGSKKKKGEEKEIKGKAPKEDFSDFTPKKEIL